MWDNLALNESVSFINDIYTQGKYPKDDCIFVSEKAIFWL